METWITEVEKAIGAEDLPIWVKGKALSRADDRMLSLHPELHFDNPDHYGEYSYYVISMYHEELLKAKQRYERERELLK